MPDEFGGDIWREIYTPCPWCCRHLSRDATECHGCRMPLAAYAKGPNPLLSMTLEELQAVIERMRDEVRRAEERAEAERKSAGREDPEGACMPCPWCECAVQDEDAECSWCGFPVTEAWPEHAEPPRRYRVLTDEQRAWLHDRAGMLDREAGHRDLRHIDSFRMDGLVTVMQVAIYLGIPPAAVRRGIRRGEFQAVREKRLLLIDPEQPLPERFRALPG